MLTLDLSRTWTPEHAASKIGADWMTPDRQWEPWERDRGGFYTALSAAVAMGLCEVRSVTTAQHAETGERRVFASTDADCPKSFGCVGLRGKARWLALSSYAEWRTTPTTPAR